MRRSPGLLRTGVIGLLVILLSVPGGLPALARGENTSPSAGGAPASRAAPRSTPTHRANPPERASNPYGVVTHTRDRERTRWFLERLGVAWYLDYTARPARVNVPTDNIPGDHQKVLSIPVSPGSPALPRRRIEATARRQPGAVWYLGREPNRRFAPGDALDVFHYYYTEIKAADPTARITSPSVLNWDFT